MILRVKKNDDFDYLYCLRQYRSVGIERGGNFEYAGIYYRKDGKLYDTQYDINSFSGIGSYEIEGNSKEALRELLKLNVRKMVEATISSREKLNITALSDERNLKELEYYQKYSAYNKAHEAYLSGNHSDTYNYSFKCNYVPKEWSEESLLDYILDPEQYTVAEVAAYVESQQEYMLLCFLQGDMLASEYRKIIENPSDPVHSVKRIMQALNASPAKTVVVTIRKDDIDFTFKAEADQYRRDCMTDYNNWHIVASDRREFERIFGRNARYTPVDIVKIMYSRAVLYSVEGSEEGGK
jgi:hypothetical protein